MRGKMKFNGFFISMALFFVLLPGCATIPVVQENALPPIPFSELIAQVEQYKGNAVILGGYVLEVENQKDHTRILAVQAPLGFGQHVKSKDLSEGRLVLIYDGFIDPEVYTKGRQITVGGTILDGADNDPEVLYPYLRIQANSIHLWPEEKPRSPDYFNEDVWLYHYPYPWYWSYPYSLNLYREHRQNTDDQQ